NLEKEIHAVTNELKNKTYKPGNYKEFFIFKPKIRKISAAPYRDRVVHHALCNLIEPIFESIFIYDSYANRKHKGTHNAIKRYQKFARVNDYVLKCDIKKYFPSIDHEILKEVIRKKIKCNNTLWLIDNLIDNSNPQDNIIEYFDGDDLFTPFERKRGLPIGNLTSQFFANIYLNPLDHFIREKLKCKYYVRYVDDFLVLSNNKYDLRIIRRNISEFLEKLRLRLHDNKSKIYSTEKGVVFLGHKVFRDFRLLKKENIIEFKRRLKNLSQNYLLGNISDEKIKASINGWIAHAKFSNTYRLREKIFNHNPYIKTLQENFINN
ncbi:reverse transcriptase domain-containing protein, partial [Bacteroidota bacterium]